jgi:hypothetical protein
MQFFYVPFVIITSYSTDYDRSFLYLAQRDKWGTLLVAQLVKALR